MNVNKVRASRAITNAKRELRNGIRSLNEQDYAGALNYFQEGSEYAVKAVLIAYGLDYPKIHGIGRFLTENKEKFPDWFGSRVDEIGEVVDGLARNRPKFRYPYEYPLEEHKPLAEEMRLRIRKLLDDCEKLLNELFKT